MKIRTSLSYALLLVCSFITAQEIKIPAVPALTNHKLSSGIMTFPNGVRVSYQITGDLTALSGGTNLTPAFGNAGYSDGSTYHHLFSVAQQYVGYDLQAEPVPNTDKLELNFEPLSVDWERPGQPKIPAPQPALPVAQIIGPGEEIAMDLAVDPATGQKITEHLKWSKDPPPSVEKPRDLTLDDVNLHLTLPALFAGRQKVGQSALSQQAAIFALHLPEGGWLYLSLKPYEGYNFEKAGVVQNSRAEFTVGSQHYELRSRSVICLSLPINLYVLFDQRNPASQGSIRSFLAPNARRPGDYMELRAGTAKQILPQH